MRRDPLAAHARFRAVRASPQAVADDGWLARGPAWKVRTGNVLDWVCVLLGLGFIALLWWVTTVGFRAWTDE